MRSLRVASMDDQPAPQKATEFTIRATVFVLACGAVANARQLLLSKAGNEHDQVGRNFMCHPLTTITAVSAGGYLSASENRLMNGQTPNGDRMARCQTASASRAGFRPMPNSN